MAKPKVWRSKLGFILAASGAAVGLGNIQRFPYVLANYGGGAFLAVYLLCVLLLGIPLVLAEFSLGRSFRENPFRVFQKALPQGKIWKSLSLLPILIPFFIFVYYAVISGWTVAYTVLSSFGGVTRLEDLTSHVGISFASTVLILSALCFVSARGLNKGVESMSSLLMPALFAILVFLALNSLTLEKSMEGLRFFFQADWSRVDGKLFVFAAGQAFFSLCIGEGVLLTYGSYVGKEDNLITSSLSMVLFDTLVAILSGLIIFPAVFSFGFTLDQDSTMIYKVMPEIFSRLPFGSVLSFAFFLTLCFAAITTCLALMEVVVNFFSETFSWKRKKSVLVFYFLSLPLSLIVSLSKGGSDYLSNLEIESLGLRGLYDILDFVCGNLAMLLCGFFIAVIAGWRCLPLLKKELKQGAQIPDTYLFVWGWLLRYLAPLGIFVILLFNFF